MKTRTPSLPTPDTLALIAASLTKCADMRPAVCPAEAVQYALRRWTEARRQLEQEAGRLKTPTAAIKMPAKFPAMLNDFLKLIVKAKTPADSTKRLRDCFYQSVQGYFAPDKTKEIETFALDRLARLTTEGIPTQELWRKLAGQYDRCWKVQKSHKARLSAVNRSKKKQTFV